MKIKVSNFVTPGQNTIFSVTAVAITATMLAYTSLIGPLSILVMYGLWFPLLAIGYRYMLRDFAGLAFVLMIPAFAFLSMFWSDYPAISLRGAIQYGTMVAIAIIAARVTTLLDFTRGLVLGLAVVLLVSLAFGVETYYVLDGEYAFTGLFRSKNEVGLYASFCLFFSYTGVFVLKDAWRWRIIYFAAALLSVWLLVRSASATSIITVIATLGVVVVLGLIVRLPDRYRRGALVMAFAILPALMLTAMLLDLDQKILGAFGKDSTLTGRTYLWSEGIRIGSERPWFGLGYQAFWVHDRIDAERLWYEFYIGDRTGFHFHNVYIESFVSLGVVGLGLVSAIFIKCFLASFIKMQSGPTRRMAIVLFGTLFLIFARSNAEVDVLGPYGLGAFLFFAQACYLSGRNQAVRQPAATLSPDPPAAILAGRR